MSTEREIQRINSRKLRALGVIKYCLDARSSFSIIDQRAIDKVPFSKNYRTYEDYRKDVVKILDVGMEGKEIPDNLFNKLMEAKMEVDDWLKTCD